MTPLDQLLQDKPLTFMRRHAVSPPDGAGTSFVPDPTRRNADGKVMNKMVTNQKLTSPQTIWNDKDGLFSDTTSSGVDYRTVKGGKVMYANVIDVPRDKPGAKTFNLSAVYSAARVPIYFLPWNSGSMVTMKLKEANGEDNDDPDNPGIFFTAALSGCSVFVDGAPTRPRIVHAGLTGKIAQTAKDFWEERLVDLAGHQGMPIDDHLLSIDKSRYMNTIWGRAYKQWLEDEYKGVLTINSVSEWACVFGIRFGRLWSFYLQKNATVTTHRVLKKSDVSSSKSHGKRVFKHKGTNLPVNVRAKGKGLISRHKKIYTLTQSYARPIMIEEFFPTRTGNMNAMMQVEDRYIALM